MTVANTHDEGPQGEGAPEEGPPEEGTPEEARAGDGPVEAPDPDHGGEDPASEAEDPGSDDRASDPPTDSGPSRGRRPPAPRASPELFALLELRADVQGLRSELRAMLGHTPDRTLLWVFAGLWVITLFSLGLLALSRGVDPRPAAEAVQVLTPSRLP